MKENQKQLLKKIVLGRINKFYQEICLVDQEFVKDPSKKVSDILKDSKKFLNLQDLKQVKVSKRKKKTLLKKL